MRGFRLSRSCSCKAHTHTQSLTPSYTLSKLLNPLAIWHFQIPVWAHACLSTYAMLQRTASLPALQRGLRVQLSPRGCSSVCLWPLCLVSVSCELVMSWPFPS